jgi:hypothetical protein
MLSILFATVGVAADAKSDAGKAADSDKPAEKYTLRYKFHAGETLRWNVEHQTLVRATYGGATKSSEMQSESNKAWRVVEVHPNGEATIEHRVEWIDMRQKLSGVKEVHYDSRTDAKPPQGFEGAAKAVGVLLSTIQIDAAGKVVSLKRHNADPQKQSASQPTPQDDCWLTVPLPSEPVAIGHAWSVPQNIEVPVERGAIRKIKAMQRFVLEEVQTGVATIRVSTDILTPVTDPAIESQLVQRDVSGRVRFDIDEGRVIGQQMNIDRSVIGFRGDASSMHYVNRFSERLQPVEAKTAEKAK